MTANRNIVSSRHSNSIRLIRTNFAQGHKMIQCQK